MATQVSIVMATYIGEAYIAPQLRSILAQTLPPFELVVSDDGSTDGTLRIVRRFESVAPFPVLVRENAVNLGYGENFLSACELDTGDAIAFCDQDDVWYANKLRRAVEVLDRWQCGLCVHAADVIDDRGARRGTFMQGIRRTEYNRPLSLAPWRSYYGFSMVFRRGLLDVIDRERRVRHIVEYQGLLSHDDWVYFLANTLTGVAFCHEPLDAYRRHSANVTVEMAVRTVKDWTSSWGRAADLRLGLDENVRHRADFLSEVAANSGIWQAAALAGQQYWEDVGRLEAGRLHMYEGKSFNQRVRETGLLLKRGAYRKTSATGGALGRKLLARDAVACTLRLRRSAFPWLP